MFDPDRFKDTVEGRGFIPKQLASLSGYSHCYICDLMSGRRSPNPTIGCIESLAIVLGVKPAYLAGWEDQ